MPALLAFLGALTLAPAWVSAQTACSPTPDHLCLPGLPLPGRGDLDGAGPRLRAGEGGGADGGYGVLLVLLGRERRAGGQGARRPGGEPALLGVLRRALGRPVHADRHRLRTGARAVFTNPRGQLASGRTSPRSTRSRRGAARASGGPPIPRAVPPEAPLRLGPEFQANVTTAGDQLLPAVAVAPDGGFMVVWTQDSNPFSASSFDLFGRLRRRRESAHRRIRLNETPLTGYQPRARVAANAAGGYMVVWSDSAARGRLAQARLLGLAGNPWRGDPARRRQRRRLSVSLSLRT